MIGYEGLKDFDVASLLQDAAGQPLELPVEHIEPDPHNVRRSYGMQALAELADSIAEHGLIQAITVRRHPDKPGYYQIVAGERRWRAHVLLKRATIAAVIRDDLGVYAQATENLQREELAVLDILHFVRERRAAGESLAHIGKQLAKSKAFVGKAAQVADAPQDVLEAMERGQVTDLGAAYALARAAHTNLASVRELLGVGATVSRDRAEALLARLKVQAPASDPVEAVAPVGTAPASPTPPKRTAGGRPRAAARHTPAVDALFALPAASPAGSRVAGIPMALGVDVAGRNGTWHPPARPVPGDDMAEVCFDDGERSRVPLAQIRLTAWREA